MLHVVEGNSKLVHTARVFFLTWSLPSRTTCPYSTPTCRRKCYARDAEAYPGPRRSREENYQESLKASFVQDMTAYIEGYLQKPKLRGRTVFFRIHQSGDFYSRAYLDKWIAIARHFTGRKIIFQAYTKSLDYFNGRDLSRLNIKVLYSVWHDTPPDQVTVAKRMGLALFVAATPIEVVGLENEGAVVCPWTCGTCQECYTGTAKLIAIPYH